MTATTPPGLRDDAERETVMAESAWLDREPVCPDCGSPMDVQFLMGSPVWMCVRQMRSEPCLPAEQAADAGEEG